MICPRCKNPCDSLTKDHVFPKWLFKRLGNFGKEFPIYKGRLTQKICLTCNNGKGGELDFTDPDVRAWVMEVQEYFIINLARVEV